MIGKDFPEVIDLIVKEDRRYDKKAYFFVRNALNYTLDNLNKKDDEEKSRHVTCRELLEGIRAYALDQYGPMALMLLGNWGLKECSHLGDIVFNLIEYSVFGKTETDSKEDFNTGYDFHEAFAEPFQPKNSVGGAPTEGKTGDQ